MLIGCQAWAEEFQLAGGSALISLHKSMTVPRLLFGQVKSYASYHLDLGSNFYMNSEILRGEGTRKWELKQRPILYGSWLYLW